MSDDQKDKLIAALRKQMLQLLSAQAATRQGLIEVRDEVRLAKQAMGKVIAAERMQRSFMVALLNRTPTNMIIIEKKEFDWAYVENPNLHYLFNASQEWWELSVGAANGS